MSKRKTQNEYVKEVSERNPNVKVLGIYIDNKTKILHGCKKCGNEWLAIPSNILKGCGCKSCSQKEGRAKNPFRKMLRKSHAQYISELSEKNPTIELMDEYISTDHKNKFKCKICGYEWLGYPGSYLSGKGCYKCGKRKMALSAKRTTEQFILEIAEINSDIEILGEYTGNSSKISVCCKKCGRIWSPYASALLSGHGCECNKIKLTRGILETNKNDDISILEQINIKTFKCKCNKCGHEWIAISYYISAGRGCPNCHNYKGEVLTKKFLKNMNIDYICQYKYSDLKGIRNYPLRYDFYIPSYNVLLEFQGIQHFQPVDYFGGNKQYIIQQIHDLRKRKYAKEHNINFLTIWYNEINKISQILTQYLNNLKLESVTTVISSIAI